MEVVMETIDFESKAFKDGVERLKLQGENSPCNLKITENMPLVPDEFLDLIDEFYLDAKKNKISRMDPKWGIWSQKMNIEISDRIDNGDPISDKLKYVMIYWVLMSELLELHFKYPYYGENKKKKVFKEAKTLKNIILEIEDVTPDNFRESITERIVRAFSV